MPNTAGMVTPVISNAALALVVLLIAALALMFYLVFRWMQRAEQAGYLGKVYRDSVFQFEKSRLCQRVEEKRSQREFELHATSEKPWNKERPKISWQFEQLILEAQQKAREDGGATRRPGSGGFSGSGIPLPPPPGLGTSWGSTSGGTGWGSTSGRNPFGTDEPELPYLFVKLDGDAQRLVDDYNKSVEEYNEAHRSWRSEIAQMEERAYQDAIAKATEEAEKLADQAADVDMAVFRGRGAAFVLEFTAIVVIIFAALILGIIGPLDGQQIGTLLAAIAGYVLGKSTSGGRETQDRNVRDGGGGVPERRPSETNVRAQTPETKPDMKTSRERPEEMPKPAA